MLVLATAAPANADPLKGQPITLECDNGVTYEAVFRGAGPWTVAQDTASNAVLVPINFAEGRGVVTDAQGNIVSEGVFPPVDKGNVTHVGGPIVTCSYTVTGTFEDPVLGTLTFTATGVVSTFVTPAS
jgi:hypothetical protein